MLDENHIGVFFDGRSVEGHDNTRRLDSARDLIGFIEPWTRTKQLSSALILLPSSEDGVFEAENFRKLGFQVEYIEERSEAGGYKLLALILMWLWDNQRRFPTWKPHLIVISADITVIPMLSSVKQRSVYVTIILDKVTYEEDLSSWSVASDEILDISELRIQERKFSKESTEDVVFQDHTIIEKLASSESFAISDEPFRDTESDWKIQTRNPEDKFNPSGGGDSSSYLDSRYVPTSVAPSQLLETEDSDPLITMEEQRDLVDKLSHGMHTGNVSFTVFVLRTIYAKQTKGFRIPTILTYITPEGSNISDAPFIFRCVLWCFGGQKGDSVQSFKYKMNKNIARWLVKDLQRRAISTPMLQDLITVAINTSQELLRQVAEFDIALDILQTARAPDPLQILYPFVYPWVNCADQITKKNVRNFCRKNGINDRSAPPLQEMTMTRQSIMSPILHSVPTPVMQSYAVPIMEPSYFVRDNYLVPPTRMPMPNNMNMSSVNMAMSSSGGAPITDLALINQRLLAILQKAPHGVLGARIPDIYEKEFGKPLYLHHNMRLKDILLGALSVTHHVLTKTNFNFLILMNRFRMC